MAKLPSGWGMCFSFKGGGVADGQLSAAGNVPQWDSVHVSVQFVALQR